MSENSTSPINIDRLAPIGKDGRCLCGDCVGDGFDMWLCNEKAKTKCTHKFELIGMRGPEVGVWMCEKCGMETS